MKFLVLTGSFLCCLQLLGQTKLLLSDKDRVSYTPDSDKEVDSLVFVHDTSGFFMCLPYEVYFDSSFQKLAYKSYSVGDTCYMYQYWRSGQLKKYLTHWLNEEGTPIWWYDESYCDNGQLIFKGPSPNQPGRKHYISYYCNGNKRAELDHIDGGADGKMTMWHESGQVFSEEYFDMDKPIGLWKYWTEDGQLYKTESYKDGKHVETIEYEVKMPKE